MTSKKEKEIVAKNIRKLLERTKRTQTDMAKDLNIPEMTVSNWMRAATYPRIDKVQLMAEYFGVYRSGITEEETNNIIQEPESQYTVYSTTISAGLPDNVDGITNTESISLPNAVMGKWTGSDVVIMRINGESMNKVIPHNSLIAIKSIELVNLKNDDIVVFSNDNEYSIKRFYNDEENKRFIFSPESNDKRFIDYTVPYDQTDNLKIHGKVVVYIVELD